MAPDATTLIEEILAQVQRVGALCHPVVRMTHLAACLGVFFMKQRMQPEWIKPMSFNHTGSRAAIAAVTGGAAEFIRIVNLQQFFARMADKRTRQIIETF